ncbi:uncharacterized protein A1O9_07837 [Exophiala aquamarina CBS 119918]|uniref:NmrA-like domain-containing protein n=1 Tax=Exophiala aquamarina CBS 119918 TaxID=1182545 RepID=A0A072P8U7_9EURO|nr:uncharacterized protein A1O9_07837 [Exophiala aquamarina CBS 119918]KEF56256.1 hypothetical protein A1O9_07837 [Exophiala aquamarina CBS 119918]
MSKIIVVIGLTGQQGGSVADAFLEEKGWKVRGVTRDPTKATGWSKRGVDVVEGDLDDKSSLMKAFEGAYAVFGTTDFWGPVSDPASKLKLGSGQKINEYAFNCEVQRGKNIAEAAAETESVERFITSALPNARACTNGRLKHVYHFDSKAAVVEYVKRSLPTLAKKMSVLYIGSYMTNWGQGIQPRQHLNKTWRLSLVGKGDTPIPHLFTSKDTGFLVHALLQLSPGTVLSGAGDILSWKECLHVWCKTQGLDYGGFDEISVEDFIQHSGMGTELGLEFGEMFAFMDSPGYNGGGDSVIFPKDVCIPPGSSTIQHSTYKDLVKISLPVDIIRRLV